MIIYTKRSIYRGMSNARSLSMVSTLQCVQLHCVYNVYMYLPSYLHRRHRIVDRHWVDIVSSSCLHRLNRRYRNVDQHRVDIAFTSCTFFLVYIVDNAMFIDIESTPCLYIPLLSCIDRNCVYMYIVCLLNCITSSTLQC